MSSLVQAVFLYLSPVSLWKMVSICLKGEKWLDCIDLLENERHYITGLRLFRGGYNSFTSP